MDQYSLCHPQLQKLPDGLGSHSRCGHSAVQVLAREDALDGRHVQRAGPRVAGVDVAREPVDDAGRGDVVAVARLHGLVNVEHVDAVVPRVRVQHRRVPVRLHPARPVLVERLVDGRRARPALQPDAQRSAVGVLTRLEEPEEQLLGVVL